MGDIYSGMNRIMDSMLVVYNILKKNSFGVSGLSIEFDLAMKRVKSFLSLNDNEAALFTYIFVNYFDYNERPVSMAMLSSDAGCNPIRFLLFSEELTTLEEKCFITADTTNDATSKAKFYRISDGVAKAIVKSDEKLLAESLKIRDKKPTYPDEIVERELSYTEKMDSDVRSLCSYLEPEKLEAIQDRLSRNAMAKGNTRKNQEDYICLSGVKL